MCPKIKSKILDFAKWGYRDFSRILVLISRVWLGIYSTLLCQSAILSEYTFRRISICLRVYIFSLHGSKLWTWYQIHCFKFFCSLIPSVITAVVMVQSYTTSQIFKRTIRGRIQALRRIALYLTCPTSICPLTSLPRCVA